MVPIRTFVQFVQDIVSAIPAINRVIRVETEAQLIKHAGKIERDELVLVIVTPSVQDNLLDPDNKSDENYGMAYILKKVDPSATDQDDELNILEETQNAAEALRALIYAKKDDPTAPYFQRHFKFQNLNPEHNMSGCNGYSWSFSIKD